MVDPMGSQQQTKPIWGTFHNACCPGFAVVVDLQEVPTAK